MRHGHIIEIGTHGELMAADGRYAKLFRLQAGAFQGSDVAMDAPVGHQ
jgi:hypothetical protein